MVQKKRVFVVDDEPSIRELVSDVLVLAGLEIVTATDGLSALDMIRKEKFDLFILDINLPKIDGFTLLEKIRERDTQTPIIMLTARVEKDDVTHGLRSGADDYVRKPFSVEELVLRVKGLLRRTSSIESTTIVCGPLVIDEMSHTVTLHEKVVDLSPTEFNLLLQLMEQPNMVHTKERLLEKVWGLDFETSTNVVDTYISYLRKKLHKDGFEGIKTVRGIGFKIEAE